MGKFLLPPREKLVLSRRKFLVGLGAAGVVSALSRPAIVRAASLSLTGAGQGTNAAISGGYSPEATAFFARIPDPGTTRKNLYAAAIDATVSAGVWAKLDALVVPSAADSATALTSLINATFNATAINSPTFTVDKGFTGASTTKYLTTNFNASTAASPKFSQNDASLFAWAVTDDGSGSNGNIISDATSVIYPRNAGTAQVVINGGGFFSATVASPLGFTVLTRRSSTDGRLYKPAISGTALATNASASLAPGNNTLLIGSPDSNNYLGICGLYGIGSQLSDADITALYNAWHPYMQAVPMVA